MSGPTPAKRQRTSTPAPLSSPWEPMKMEIDLIAVQTRKEDKQSNHWEKEKSNLQKQESDLKAELLEANVSSIDQFSEMKKDTVETTQKRLSNMAELKKKEYRLQATEHSLRGSVCNKMFLREQIHLLTTRVEAQQPVQRELHEAKVKLASVESSLEEWTSTAPGHSGEAARALSPALESALSNQLTAVASTSQAQTQLAQRTEEVATVKSECDKSTAKLSCKVQEREQKRLLSVDWDCDTYIQKLECCEKRFESHLEQLDKECHDLQHQEDSDNRSLKVTELMAKVEEARRYALIIRTQRDRMETHFDTRSASVGMTVVHPADNPSAVAQKQVQMHLEDAQEERSEDVGDSQPEWIPGGEDTFATETPPPEPAANAAPKEEADRLHLKRLLKDTPYKNIYKVKRPRRANDSPTHAENTEYTSDNYPMSTAEWNKYQAGQEPAKLQQATAEQVAVDAKLQ